jgi:hypothetical protein
MIVHSRDVTVQNNTLARDLAMRVMFEHRPTAKRRSAQDNTFDRLDICEMRPSVQKGFMTK